MQAANRLVDVDASSSEEMYESSKVAGRVEGKGIKRVWYEPSFIVNLAASMKQVDVHCVRNISTTLVLRRMAVPVTQFDALDE